MFGVRSISATIASATAPKLSGHSAAVRADRIELVDHEKGRRVIGDTYEQHRRRFGQANLTAETVRRRRRSVDVHPGDRDEPALFFKRCCHMPTRWPTSRSRLARQR